MGARAASETYRFDRFTLDLARGVLLGPSGEIPLRPKSLALLRLLAENAGRTVDRDRIMAALWPDVVVTDESITQCVRDIRQALGDEGRKLLRTLPKRGYLLAAEVSEVSAATPSTRIARWPVAAAAALLSVCVAGGVWWFWPSEARERSAVAVLPFENLTGDAATGRFADGITEDVITDLARFRDLDVIARNSTEAYRAKPTDVRRIAKDLDVGYVLAGSIQRQDDRVRVTAQLAAAGTGADIWSDRWDRPAQDLFAVQSEIAETVAARLGGGTSYAAITASEAQRAKVRSPLSLTAYEHYLIAAEAHANPTEPLLRSGLEHADMAIALDPNFARAYTVRGWLHWFLMDVGADFEMAFARAKADFHRALELDPLDAEAHAAVGFLLSIEGKFPEAAAEIHKALAISPSHIHVLAAAATTLPYAGDPDGGLAAAERAVRLDPQMPPAVIRGVHDGFFFGRAFDRTVQLIERMPADTRNFYDHFALAASYAFLGRVQEAQAAKAAMATRTGNSSAELALNHDFIFAREQERDLFVDAYRRLGLSVCAKPDELAKFAKPATLRECEEVRAKVTSAKAG